LRRVIAVDACREAVHLMLVAVAIMRAAAAAAAPSVPSGPDPLCTTPRPETGLISTRLCTCPYSEQPL
jgi:hypothetical protein